jgi:hypothetical protein
VLLVVGGAPLGQLAKLGLLDLDPLAVLRVAAADNLVDEPSVGIEVGEVSAAAQQQLVLDLPLQVAMRALDGTVLVRDAGVVARRRHAVVGDQRLVTLRQVVPRITVEVAERRRQTIAAVHLRNAAQRPQRVLQALGERDVALSAQHDVRVLEAGERETEAIEPMVECRARDHDRERRHVGEVGQPHASRRMLLGEHHVLLGAVQRAPLTDAPLQRAAHALGQLRMAAAHLVEDADGTDAGRGGEHRHDLGLHRWAIGSARRRSRGSFFCDGNRGSVSIR